MIVGKGHLAENKHRAAVGFDAARVYAVPTKSGRHAANWNSGRKNHALRISARLTRLIRRKAAQDRVRFRDAALRVFFATARFFEVRAFRAGWLAFLPKPEALAASVN